MAARPGRRQVRRVRPDEAALDRDGTWLVVEPYAADDAADNLNPVGRVYYSASTPYVYVLAFFGLILGFTFFYVSITFNPDELSDNIRKNGGFVPGLRPGPPTSTYLAYVLSRLTAPGSVYLALVAMFPLVVIDKIGLGQDLQLSGVSLLIMAGVGLDTVKQIQSQLEQHSYEGFLG